MFVGNVSIEVFESIKVCKFRRRFKDLGKLEIGRLEALRYLNNFSLQVELGSCVT
jgi:hypothetical protein